MQHLFFIALLLATWPYLATARSVSYPSGITLMQMNNVDFHSIHLHYSPTAKYSVGYRGEYWRDENWQFHGVQLNRLFKRWNQPTSQANFYLKSGLGLAYSDFKTLDHETTLAAFLGMALDWEDRRFFTSYENRIYEAGRISRFFTQQARIGIAPYIGDYGDLHTWLMLQVRHTPEKDNPITVTPFIRLFKGEYLAEFGVDDQGDALLNFIIRF